MSDYISKSALIKVIEKSLRNNKHYTIEGSVIHQQEHRHLIHLVEKQPTVDEKEIIRKPFERVLERLEEKRNYSGYIYEANYFDGIDEAIEICKEEGGIE